jgi:hypothetical protein
MTNERMHPDDLRRLAFLVAVALGKEPSWVDACLNAIQTEAAHPAQGQEAVSKIEAIKAAARQVIKELDEDDGPFIQSVDALRELVDAWPVQPTPAPENPNPLRLPWLQECRP